MTITNDQIVFEVSDLLEFSPQLQADLVFRAGPQTTAHEYLSARVNAILEESTNVHNKDSVEKVEDVALAFAKAGKGVQDSIKVILGIT